MSLRELVVLLAAVLIFSLLIVGATVRLGTYPAPEAPVNPRVYIPESIITREKAWAEAEEVKE